MSYIRWGSEGSDVYVFDGGLLTCCRCELRESGDNFTTDSHRMMLAHLGEHRTAGHVVPAAAFERLEQELSQLGDDL